MPLFLLAALPFVAAKYGLSMASAYQALSNNRKKQQQADQNRIDKQKTFEANVALRVPERLPSESAWQTKANPEFNKIVAAGEKGLNYYDNQQTALKGLERKNKNAENNRAGYGDALAGLDFVSKDSANPSVDNMKVFNGVANKYNLNPYYMQKNFKPMLADLAKTPELPYKVGSQQTYISNEGKKVQGVFQGLGADNNPAYSNVVKIPEKQVSEIDKTLRDLRVTKLKQDIGGYQTPTEKRNQAVDLYREKQAITDKSKKTGTALQQNVRFLINKYKFSPNEALKFIRTSAGKSKEQFVLEMYGKSISQFNDVEMAKQMANEAGNIYDKTYGVEPSKEIASSVPKDSGSWLDGIFNFIGGKDNSASIEGSPSSVPIVADVVGNTVTINGKQYPLNSDGTITIDGKHYKVNY